MVDEGRTVSVGTALLVCAMWCLVVGVVMRVGRRDRLWPLTEWAGWVLLAVLVVAVYWLVWPLAW